MKIETLMLYFINKYRKYLQIMIKADNGLSQSKQCLFRICVSIKYLAILVSQIIILDQVVLKIRANFTFENK